MGIIGGVFFMVGIGGVLSGHTGFIIAIIIGWIMMQSEINEGNTNNSSSNNSTFNNEINTTNNSYVKNNTIVKPPVNSNKQSMEVYVIVRFDNYPRHYTYLAPFNRFLKTGERVRIRTSSNELKYVTVIKGNFKCPVKTDRRYSRLHIE